MEIAEVKDRTEGAKVTFGLLKTIVNAETVMFISGGSSPKDLYKLIAQDKTQSVKPLAFCTVDERWGPPGHKNSNELMIGESGLYDYAENAGIEVHKILAGILNRSETANRYNVVLEGLFARASKSVAIMGIGEDGHTAGIAPGVKIKPDKLVDDYNFRATGWQFPERITLTPKAIDRVDELIIIAYGGEKLSILRKLVKGDIEVYAKCHAKSFLVTDQHLR